MANLTEKLINTDFEYLEGQFIWPKGAKQVLERLRENLPKIQVVVNFASSQEQINDPNFSLNIWLWQLRDAIDEADDVFDDLEYMKLEKQLTKNKKQRKVRSIIKSIKKIPVKIARHALKIDPNLKRLEIVVQKLDKVSSFSATFVHFVKYAEQENQGHQLELYRVRGMGSLPTHDLIGRGKEKEFVMKWLRNPSNEYQATFYKNISLLCIVGHGGMGKTTLLQHVYEEVKKEEFDLKMWVCVSNNFNVEQVIANMLKVGTCSETLDAIQIRLQTMVESKKFLLILDDVWDDVKDEGEYKVQKKWGNVLAPLASGKLGSKILVTTRMESGALMISKVMSKKNETLKLKGLNNDECLQVLLRYAFHDTEENFEVHHNLRSIAEKMIKKLLGSPLAARVMGSILKSPLEETHWTRVLNSDIGSHNDILLVLKLSYTFLPKVLQKCLSFCCTFPQDYELDKVDLIQMWIALDFIQPPKNQRETLNDVGKRYFDILVRKSLLDKFQESRRTYYKVDNLLYYMVRVISAQEFFSVVDDEQLASGIPENIRHLFVTTANLDVLRNLEKFKKLRSLFFYYDNLDDTGDCFDILTKIFKALKSIRLLIIYVPRLKRIPKEIGHLIHLRYLKIFIEETTTQLPGSLSNLYHLQFLYCKSLNTPALVIHEVGKLKSLQMLDGFYVLN